MYAHEGMFAMRQYRLLPNLWNVDNLHYFGWRVDLMTYWEILHRYVYDECEFLKHHITDTQTAGLRIQSNASAYWICACCFWVMCGHRLTPFLAWSFLLLSFNLLWVFKVPRAPTLAVCLDTAATPAAHHPTSGWDSIFTKITAPKNTGDDD